MDLKVDDVAELLNVTPNKVETWIHDGSIPCYRIGDQYRFSRFEIEDWVLKKGELSPFNPDGVDEANAQKGGSQQFSLLRAIHHGGVLHKVPGTSKEEIIRNAMKSLAADLAVDADVMTELLLDREKLQATALGNGIGLPHTRESFLKTRDRVSIVFPEKPIIDYGALDGEPVHTLIFLFASNDKRHLHLLAKIAHISNQEKTRELFKQQPNKKLLMEYIKDWESQIGKTVAEV